MDEDEVYNDLFDTPTSSIADASLEIRIDIPEFDPDIASISGLEITSSDPDIASDSLVESIVEKLKIKSLSSCKCSICKVPKSVLSANANAYIPQVISIGPFHKGKEGLEAMEFHKHGYLRSFFSRANLNLEVVVELVKSREEEARSCYAEPIKMSSDKFVELILLDGCFVVEYFIRQHPNYVGEIDDLFQYDLFSDLIKLENQLPFFVLEDLFKLYRPNDHLKDISFLDLFCTIAGLILKYNQPSNVELDHSPDHFVHILWTFFAHDVSSMERSVMGGNKKEILQSPTATELYEACVQFKMAEKNDIIVTFIKGVLEIPKIEIMSYYETCLLNLIAYEQCYNKEFYVSFFAMFMNSLIKTEEDVTLLIKAGIISNDLGSNEDVSKLFNNISKHVNGVGENYLNQVCIDMRSYCQQPWHLVVAFFRRLFFKKSVWSIIGYCAATTFFILNLVQNFR